MMSSIQSVSFSLFSSFLLLTVCRRISGTRKPPYRKEP
nr:MAG TPA: hypothetical protein [Caudoviricetes sp.]